MSRTVRFPTEQARRILAEGLPYGPQLDPCVCGAGRHAHAGADRGGSCTSTGCKRYRADKAYQYAYKARDAGLKGLAGLLRDADRLEREERRKNNPRAEGEWSIGASDTDTCPRRIWYRNTPPADYTPGPTDKRAADAGTMLHREITRRVLTVCPWYEHDVKVRIAGLDRDSEADLYDPIAGDLIDVKTAGRWKWEQIGDHGPEVETWDQALLYALALEESGRYVANVKLWYYNREQGLSEPFTRVWDDAARKQANAARERLLGYATALDMGAELPRFEDASPRHPICSRCEALRHCWSLDAAAVTGRSGYSLTYLGPSPDEEKWAWAIEQKLDADKALREAKARVEAAKDLLVGIEPGRYGGFEGWEKPTPNSGGVNNKAYIEQIAQFYEMPEDQRPPFEKIPIPRYRTSTYMHFAPVRRAKLEAEAQAGGAA